MNSIWQATHLHYRFQSSGAYFFNFNSIKLEADACPEDLYRRLMSFIKDNLLLANSPISHQGKTPGTYEEMSPTLENLIELTWLRLIYTDLPSLVKQHHDTKLRSRSLTSLKLEISQALESLLEEIHTSTDAKIVCTMASKVKPSPTARQILSLKQTSRP